MHRPSSVVAKRCACWLRRRDASRRSLECSASAMRNVYSGDTYKNGHARNLGPTESRDGGDALGFDGEVYAVLPDALTYEALTGDEERTI